MDDQFSYYMPDEVFTKDRQVSRMLLAWDYAYGLNDGTIFFIGRVIVYVVDWQLYIVTLLVVLHLCRSRSQLIEEFLEHKIILKKKMRYK